MLLELSDIDAPGAATVVSAAAQLFEAGDPVDVVLWSPGAPEASEGVAAVVQAWVLAAVDDPARLPEVLLIGDGEVHDREYALRVRAGEGPAGTARSVALLTGASLSLAPAEPPTTPPAAQAAAPACATVPAPRPVPALEHAVLLSSYGGVAAACSPLAIARELHRRGHDATRYFLVADAAVAVPAGTVPVLRDTPEHLRVLTTSRWVVDNQEMPTGFTKAPGQVLVQTWHGTPLKKLYRDLHAVAPGPEAALAERLRDAGQWDVALSPNPFTSTVLRDGFGVRGDVLEAGYPRNDALADLARRTEAAAGVRAALGVPEDHRVVLYAPTWRDDALVGWGAGARYVEQPGLDWAALRARLGERVTFLSRRHRALPAAPGGFGAEVLDVSGWPDMTDLLAATDVLVTDYSSAFFDYAATGRPMVFFTYDLEEYRGRTRGHYFAMEDVVPGPVVRTALDAVDAVATAVLDPRGEGARYAERYAAFTARFNPWDDGAAAARVVEAVFS